MKTYSVNPNTFRAYDEGKFKGNIQMGKQKGKETEVFANNSLSFKRVIEWVFNASSLFSINSTLSRAGLSDGNNISNNSILVTGSVGGEFIVADFGKNTTVFTASILHISNASSEAWTAAITNGHSLQYATEEAPTSWITLATTAGHTDGVNIPIVYPVNAVCRYVRLFNPAAVNIGVGDFLFS
jgi:hypothetical protein